MSNSAVPIVPGHDPEWRWEWAGALPPSVVDEVKRELPKELVVAEALMNDEGVGPEIKRAVKEKMNRAINGEEGAAREYVLSVLMKVMGARGDLRKDAETVLNDAVVNGNDLEWNFLMEMTPVKKTQA